MIIKDIVGLDRYELIRGTIEKAFPSLNNEVTDDTVDAFIQELQRQSPPGIETLGLPQIAPLVEAPTVAQAQYPLYVAHIRHKRVRVTGSNEPFHSEFVAQLPHVRVPLPPVLNDTTRQVSTAIGKVDLARDHKAGSVELCSQLYADALGYKPARVDLITTARAHGLRLAMGVIYLGYRQASDTAPSFYIVEFGLPTGEARVLRFGKTMDTTIVQPGGYKPSPFAAENNTYQTSLLVENNQPVKLAVQVNEPSLPYYLQVTVDYEAVPMIPVSTPLLLTLEAVERVAAIGRGMKVETGIPMLIDQVLANIALVLLPWITRPGTPQSLELLQSVAVTPLGLGLRRP